MPESRRMHSHPACPGHPVQRRSHKKSRNGCRICKQRRIKCDENKPACDNCSRCSIPCDFDPNYAISSATSATSALVPRKRGRPLKGRTASFYLSEGSLVDLRHRLSQTPSLTEKSSPAHNLNVQDLQLFHHYISNASITLGDDVLWRDKVPRLAFENPFVLNQLLGLSALHLARLSASEATKYMQLAEAHYSTALPYVTEMLPHVNQSNCSALYIAAILVCNSVFGKIPKKGHLLVVDEDTEGGWLAPIRGIRFITEFMGLPAIFSGHIGPFPVENLTEMPPTDRDKGYIPWEEPLSILMDLADNNMEPECDYGKICKSLVACFRDVYGTAAKPASHSHGKKFVVMGWLWFLDDDFVDQVKLKAPLALALLAHFAVLIQTLECYWYMEGWAHSVLDGVLEHIDPHYNIWITWPKRQIGYKSESR